MVTIINNDNLRKLVNSYIVDKSGLPDDLKDIPIGHWNVSLVTSMGELFFDVDDDEKYELFNEPLDDWDVSNVTDMFSMFKNCTNFNQPLNSWNVSKVTDMVEMFSGCTNFNQPLDDWDVSKVRIMSSMFRDCTNFNQPLTNWNVSAVQIRQHMFARCGISEENKPPRLRDTPSVSAIAPATTINGWFNSQGILTYQSVQSVPLVDSTDANVPTIDATTTIYDEIKMEDENIYEYLQEDKDNIVVVFLNKFHLISKTRLKDLCSDYSYVKYECPTIDSIRDYNKTIPYLAGKSFGVYGLIEISKVKKIIESPDIRVVQIVDFIPQKIAPSTISQTSLLVYIKPVVLQLPREEGILVNESDWSSGSHCQEGQGEIIRDIQKLPTPVFTTGGKVKRRYTVKGINKTKKKTNKKKTNKMKTNKKKTNKKKTNKMRR